MEIGIEAFRWNEGALQLWRWLRQLAPYLFPYPQLALWATRMPPASLAMSQKSHGQSTSYFLVIDERYATVVKICHCPFRASADNSYCFGRTKTSSVSAEKSRLSIRRESKLNGSKQLDSNSIPLTLKVTQASGNPGCKDLVCMPNMEKRRPRT